MLCLCLQVGDEESREQLIKTHYMARVGELTTQLQISDSKAVHFHSEVKPLLECFISITAFYSKELTLSQLKVFLSLHVICKERWGILVQSPALFPCVFHSTIIPQLFLSASLIWEQNIEAEPELNLVSLFFPVCTSEMVLGPIMCDTLYF